MVALEKPGPQAVVSGTQAKKPKQIPYCKNRVACGSLVLMGVEGLQKTSDRETEEYKRVTGI